ncbi:M56 family metallopeptidase [Mycolicibacterium mucogenicum]|uniref:M56 family metallopeptidase n=1 Tax=Mycolicibacterium mucogenicum TaxID=56689 RepID=UPI00226A7AA4|nr:M56 family metallopeptidase [Mycolicibacterium mucogenicum]MCX8565163.1 M56 family metallopeptidase [Mycolicibacterium mucogenicum]
MSIAVCLLLYAALVAVAAPRLLPYLTRGGSAPVAGVAVWLIVVASVLGSWVAAMVALVVHVARTWHRPDPLALAACLARVRSVAAGHNGLAWQVGLFAATLTVVAFLVVLTVRASRSVAAARTHSRRHAASARIIGRRVTGVDGLVIDAPQKLAYCVSGRPGTVVITSAAVAALESPDLDAVLAHERAHLVGRHHLLLAATRALATSLPRVRLFSVAHTEVSRLLEMCADDAAARRHGATALLSAIMALSGLDPVPAAALGASSVGVVARVARLADPDTAARRWRVRLLLVATAAVAVAAPVIAAWAAASGFPACGPFTA